MMNDIADAVHRISVDRDPQYLVQCEIVISLADLEDEQIAEALDLIRQVGSIEICDATLLPNDDPRRLN